MNTEETTTKPAETAEAPATTDATAPAAAPVKRKKTKRSVPSGQLHVQATFNNTIVTLTDPKGGALAASSAGACGFRGSKKGTAYAAQVATEKAGNLAKQSYGLSKVDVFVKGVGLGRDAAVRAMQTVGINIESITDVTGVPHGGVRPKKARRV
ncbi:30S ribosomal protein S11 [Candidatus Saccharibacteria bacterium]|nr:30S ribosomal protein S11 [Candidatus Saccharibacteria bacterium]